MAEEKELSSFQRMAKLLQIPEEDINKSAFGAVQGKMVEFLGQHSEAEDLTKSYVTWHTDYLINKLREDPMFEKLDNRDKSSVMQEMNKVSHHVCPVVFGMILGWYLHSKEEQPLEWWRV